MPGLRPAPRQAQEPGEIGGAPALGESAITTRLSALARRCGRDPALPHDVTRDPGRVHALGAACSRDRRIRVGAAPLDAARAVPPRAGLLVAAFVASGSASCRSWRFEASIKLMNLDSRRKGTRHPRVRYGDNTRALKEI